MKKPSKTAAELEAAIKLEMEDICERPTDIALPEPPCPQDLQFEGLGAGRVERESRGLVASSCGLG